MENFKLKNCSVHEMTAAEMVKVDGGSELSESLVRGLGYICHKVHDAFEAVDWNRFYSHAFQYT